MANNLEMDWVEEPGKGFRPEQEEKTNTRNSKAKTHTRKGVAIVTGEGPNAAVKGRIDQQIQSQVEATKKGESDPLTDQVLPKQYRDHAREYFR